MGGRKFATVLFADVRGSLALIAGADPEDAARFLGEAIAAMEAAVASAGGVVSERLGDGIVAVFGAPAAAEDHALRACRAALAILRAPMPAPPPGAGGGATPAGALLRVGLHSGEVIVDAAARGGAVVASGGTLHVAARMEQTAAPGTVRATGETVRLAGALVEAAALGPVEVKGLDRPVEAYELRGLRPGASRHHAPRADGSRGPFVGRARELAAVAEARARAEAGGGGGALLLVGEAGAGKSRLLSEALADPGFAGWRVVEVQALPDLRDAHQGARAVLAALLAGPGGEGGGGGDAGAAAASLGLPDSLREAALRLLGHAGPAGAASPAPWDSLPPIERGRRAAAAVRAALLAAAARGPLALRVEDAQWLDPESARILASVAAEAGRGAGHRILLLGTARPPGLAAAPDAWTRWVRVVPVEPLAPEEQRALLARWLPPGAASPALERLLLARAQGNPFFLEELLRSLAEQGVLRRGAGGRYAQARDEGAPQVPATVRALLAERIDRLPPDERDTLRAAAAVGAEVPLRLLRRVAPAGARPLASRVARLRAAGFLCRGPARGALAFRHALIREVAYAETLQRDRRALHLRALAAIEAMPDLGGGPRRAAWLAEHARRAEAWEPAARYGALAGAAAAARDANREAVRFLDHAIEAAARLPDGHAGAGAAGGLELRLALRGPLHRLGRIAEMARRFEEADRLAVALGDPARLARLRIYQGHVEWLRGRYGRAEGACGEALALAGEGGAAGDPGLAALARFHLAMVRFLRGDLGGALEDLGAGAPPPSRGAPTRRWSAMPDLEPDAWSYAARAHAERGERAAARAAAARAAALAERERSPFARVVAGVAEGVVLHLGGRPDAALAPLAAALRLCDEAEARLMAPVARGYLGAAQAAAGGAREALATLAAAVREGDEMGFAALQPLRLALLAEAQAANGLAAVAEATARRALATAREQGEGVSEAYALRAVARAAAAAGDRARGEAALAEAAAAARARGLAPLEASCEPAPAA